MAAPFNLVEKFSHCLKLQRHCVTTIMGVGKNPCPTRISLVQKCLIKQCCAGAYLIAFSFRFSIFTVVSIFRILMLSTMAFNDWVVVRNENGPLFEKSWCQKAHFRKFLFTGTCFYYDLLVNTGHRVGFIIEIFTQCHRAEVYLL